VTSLSWGGGNTDIFLNQLCDGVKMAIFGEFLRPVFSASRVQQVSDLHLKFALRPHHVWSGSMADIQCVTAEIRRGKKKKKNKRQDENIMVCPIP